VLVHTTPSHLKRDTVIQHASNWTTNNRYTNKPFAIACAYGKHPTKSRFVVSVKTSNKLIGLFKRYWNG
jgi:hypothetical protein